MNTGIPQNIKNVILTLFITIFIAGTIVFLSTREAWAGEFKFGFSTSLAEKYDDNIYLDEHDEEDDFITSLTPAVSISYLTENTNLSLSYHPEFEFYAENSDENDINHSGAFNLNSQLTPRLNLTVTDSLVFTPAQDTAGEGLREHRRGSRSNDSDQLNNFFNTALSYQLFHATSVHAGFSYSLENYEESEYQDSDEYSYELGMDHRLTGSDTIFCSYRYRRMFYEDDKSLRSYQRRPGYGGENDTDVQSISIGETHQFPRGLSLTVSAGIELIDEEHEDSETDWSGSASLTKTFRTGSLGLSFDRSVSTGEGEGGTVVRNSLDLTGRKDFTRHLAGSLSTFFSTEESTSGDETDNEEWGLILGVDHQISRRLSSALSGSFIRQNSDGWGEGDTDSYRARANVNYLIRPNCSAYCSYSYYQQNGRDSTEEDYEDNIVTLGIKITWF